MLTIPWLVTSYAKAIYGGKADATNRDGTGSKRNFTPASQGLQTETSQPNEILPQQQSSKERPHRQPQQPQIQKRIAEPHLSQQQQHSAPLPRQTKLPVSTTGISPKSAVPLSSALLHSTASQPQLASTLPAENTSSGEGYTTKTSSKTLILTPPVPDYTMSFEWARDQQTKYEETFDQADKDKSGSLTFAEVNNVLKEQGFTGSDKEIKFIFKFLDSDGDKKITRDEFSTAITKLPKRIMKEHAMRKMFKGLDKDGSGYLTRQEVADATKEELVGMNISANRISDMLMFVAEDADSKVHYEEFIRIFEIESTADSMRDTFKKLDTDGSGFLTRAEVLDAITADPELGMTAEKISSMVIHLVTDPDKKMSYEEFLAVWLKEREAKPKK